MGFPNDSDKSKIYAESDLNTRATNFKGKQFLLVSSIADTEVPVEHSMNFVHSLVKENVLFRHQVHNLNICVMASENLKFEISRTIIIAFFLAPKGNF